MPVLVTNKYAGHEYEILERIEAGFVLTGPEVKSIRAGHMSLKGAYAAITNGELWLLNAHVTPYKQAGPQLGYNPTRSRKLLVSKKQLERMLGSLHTQGLTLVPLKVYTAKSRLKFELGLCRGKKQYEKRDVLKKRALDRDIRQVLKRRI